MTDDVRGAILARCAELEAMAQRAATQTAGSVWRVGPSGQHEIEVLAWMGDGPADLDNLGRWNVVAIWNDDYLDTGVRTQDAYGPAASHIAAWDPDAVMELVAEVRALVALASRDASGSAHHPEAVARLRQEREAMMAIAARLVRANVPH